MRRTRDKPTMPAGTGDTLAPTIARLQAIAAQSGDSLLLADGRPHPDHQLLGLCGDALHHLRQADVIREANPGHMVDYAATGAVMRPWEVQADEHDATAMQLMRAARKLRATTPAGIYAKALSVRASRSGAQVLAMSLAAELVDCAALRQSLWPAEAVL